MNKQDDNKLMNTIQYQSDINVILLLLRNKIYSVLRHLYKINYHSVNILISFYLYNRLVKDQASITAISRFMDYYTNIQVKKCIDSLVSCDLITLAGVNHYKITDKGIAAVNLVAENYNTVLYNFCSKYNIDL